ncbi:ABC transporter substrate-binding protein [Rhodococcus sp. HNM0569]|uniref:ABC transporter substrate-binding protein n=1 Tax=Rhodococcus sp. HNM0569 TaxID=2716340 RepID=UPI00146C9137|nr:ABC transporter substrate-binding protein [Rhodococcus sp. HNM0569]NLU81292.1 peptide-binding protein [Rhodococcus sp. HNM0569]
MSVRARPAAVAAATAIAVAAGTAAGCAQSEGEQVPSIGYAIDNVLGTYNAGTVEGADSGALAAFGRVLPGFGYIGPEGGAVSDTDVGTAQQVPGDPLTIAYSFNPNAVYSDGTPLTCDDLVLAWAARSGEFPQFRAGDTAGYSDIDRIDCTPGGKDATVVFRAGRGVLDWRSLFGATTLMPSHVVRQATGVDVTTALQDGNPADVDRIAEFWNTGWNLPEEGDVDEALFPSAGPYRLDSIDDDGGVVLTANDKWWGNRPATEQIVVYPSTSDIGDLVSSGDIEVVDAGAGARTDLDGLTTTHAVSPAVEQFVLATQGTLGSDAVRRAFAACIPREDLFGEFGSASDGGAPPATGLGSGVVDSRIVASNSLLYAQAAGTAGGGYRSADTAAARSALAEAGVQSATVRVGYLTPNDARAAVVAAVAEACAPAGITVEDAGSADFTPDALRTGAVDAVLGGTGGKQGATGATEPAERLYALHSRVAANAGGFSNGRYDAIADQLAVESSTSVRLGLVQEAETLLWGAMPTLPLYDQVRAVMYADGMEGVVPGPNRAGTGWNMDRWVMRR